MLACATLLVACGGSPGSSGGTGGSGIPGGSGDPNSGESTTSGPAYSVPGSVALVAFNEGAAQTGNECAIDTSQLAQGAANQGDVVRNIYQWVVDNITYDHDKAAQLASATGYVPDPDATLASGTGICFDYASLGAAMLRSLGIPCQVITGYVSPDDVYHAWNMVYIDGEWISVEISIKPNSWTRVDLTFAASGAASTIGDGTSYTDRYTY